MNDIRKHIESMKIKAVEDINNLLLEKEKNVEVIIKGLVSSKDLRDRIYVDYTLEGTKFYLIINDRLHSKNTLKLLTNNLSNGTINSKLNILFDDLKGNDLFLIREL